MHRVTMAVFALMAVAVGHHIGWRITWPPDPFWAAVFLCGGVWSLSRVQWWLGE